MTPTLARADLDHLDALAELFDRYRRFYRQPSDVAAARAFLQARLDADESVIFVATLPDREGLVFTRLVGHGVGGC